MITKIFIGTVILCFVGIILFVIELHKAPMDPYDS